MTPIFRVMLHSSWASGRPSLLVIRYLVLGTGKTYDWDICGYYMP